MALWTALSDKIRACYGARDGGVRRRLEAQIEQHLSQDERFWERAVDDLSSGRALVCFGEEQRLSISMA